ncbi:hypothetical protein A3D81_03265 [Candidatus Curtissbacteria bacterium RIFCSPHIGHO2_02_FULL_40_17]|uniref:LysM domain-containing protein n=4 Tax=Candidatus Curtissiibacteriota TaxID=1752717 RepID=A0A1F5GJJ1_9BACT|nr:MAG: hypothetical protein A2693_04840 [Candidatus Curtissbacteria bacterium RIFCSPHIGHO2_01_FULL_40_12]OGD92056.1 MAG: hypothetical protein A3D81_03265 [Candidatus Curtissbacteria bacterium RIFCSPHIGHO2_02_FULL_40_17]OGE05008.1 MAG: hypothetical protein A3F45_02175 [Candidatus Curtissbacteria bacterium RIFCSPHIGHO2_12_FULL_41_17]OGE08706.1 MAG: hypothetical protein A3I53_00925 [Candidatus Curtissbacteria bacterium RIFCSPLOWO2_02_FULL_40_13b]
MAKSTLFKRFSKISKFNWQESYASLILGAIIVVILGLLVANFFSKRNQGTIDQADMTQQTQNQEGAPVAGSNYKVKENDSLSKISEEVYGNQEFWPALAAVNNIANANVIWVGTSLKLPAKEEVVKTKAAVGGTSYQVQMGETLFTIAQKVYGDGSKWTVLDRANGMKRLSNGNPLVYAGSTIIVPR